MTKRKDKMQEMATLNLPAGDVIWLEMPFLKAAALHSSAQALPYLKNIIEGEGAILLTIALMDPGSRARQFEIFAWKVENGQLAIKPCTTLRAGPHAVKTISHLMLDLFSDMTRRWPKVAMPSAIGIVTDGTGYAFNSSYPDGLTAEWLHSHLSGKDPASEIVPFSQNGYLKQICALGEISKAHSRH